MNYHHWKYLNFTQTSDFTNVNIRTLTKSERIKFCHLTTLWSSAEL